MKETPTETLPQEVWRKAVREFECDLMRACPPLTNGKREKETHEQYARRCIAEVERVIGRLREAREEYHRVGGEA